MHKYFIPNISHVEMKEEHNIFILRLFVHYKLIMVDSLFYINHIIYLLQQYKFYFAEGRGKSVIVRI